MPTLWKAVRPLRMPFAGRGSEFIARAKPFATVPKRKGQFCRLDRIPGGPGGSGLGCLMPSVKTPSLFFWILTATKSSHPGTSSASQKHRAGQSDALGIGRAVQVSMHCPAEPCTHPGSRQLRKELWHQRGALQRAGWAFQKGVGATVRGGSRS